SSYFLLCLNLSKSKYNKYDNAVDYVSKCNTCQKYNIARKDYNPHRPVYAYVPGDAYAFDLMGPFQSCSAY
ncbi:uncharacterized protein RHIMIDRAFT_256908, partial [Rhizopus microsporus ATCC 52813]